MSAEVRRRAAENAFQRAQQAGHVIEQDQRFHTWIEEWISGRMTMPEVAMRYRALVIERSAARRAGTAPHLSEILQKTKTASGAEPEQPFDLETEINRLMAEDQR
ncbi:hypothetical protein [Pararhizobium sp. DWP3-4]|uniref:hypothetical protein n=1 Tax=unclassified Pararhizobium TaxID=2643050 RepID=UPI003CEECFA2